MTNVRLKKFMEIVSIMYKILLADDEQVFVNGLEEVFNYLPNYEVASVIQNVDNLAMVCKKLKPDLVITRTFFFLQRTGFEAVENLKKACPDIKVIMMLDTGKYAQVEHAYDSGADACINRSASPLDFVYVIEKTMADQPVVMSVDGGNSWGPHKVQLNRIELDIILCLCKNLSDEEMAKELEMTEDALEAHIANVLAKTRHKNRMGLIFEAVHKGYEVSWRAEAC